MEPSPDDPEQFPSVEEIPGHSIDVPENGGGNQFGDVQNVDSELGWKMLDPGHIRVEQISNAILLSFLVLGAIVGLAIKWFYGGFDVAWFVVLGCALVVLGLQLWASTTWPKLSYKRLRWRIDDAGLEICRGVFWRSRDIVPLARVQHADVSQGPLQRQWNLGTLTVHTAGSSNASVDLPGLKYSIAIGLRDHLVRQRIVAANLEAQQLNTEIDDEDESSNFVSNGLTGDTSPNVPVETPVSGLHSATEKESKESESIDRESLDE